MFDMFKKSGATSDGNLEWKTLQDLDGLDALIERSKEVPVAIFKHSIRCGISAQMKHRFETEWNLDAEAVEVYYLDLITYRPVSNAIAEKLGVPHQSPQVILLKDGAAVYSTSHYAISADKLGQALNA